MSRFSSVLGTYQNFVSEDAEKDAGILTLAYYLSELADATKAIAHGDTHGPGGLEGLTMALAAGGVAGHESMASIIGSGLAEIARAIEEKDETDL